MRSRNDCPLVHGKECYDDNNIKMSVMNILP
jgi:hypothetical protein